MISVVEITRDSFHRFQDSILAIEKVSFPSPWSLNAFSQELNRSVSNLWALLVDRKLGGYICFWVIADEIHLMNIAIHPSMRRRGLARYLLARMIREGVSKGVRRVWLEVRPSNVTARHLYQEAGFVETGRRHRYYSDTNEDAIIMSLLLNPEDTTPVFELVSTPLQRAL
jgi:ribosomal-protein-alanine N-acetyltransferase